MHISESKIIYQPSKDGKILEMLLGMIAVAGILGLFISSFSIQMGTFGYFAVLLGVAATAFFSDVNKNHTMAAIINTAVVFLLALLILLFHHRIMNGILVLLNQIISAINTAMDFTWHEFVVSGSVSSREVDIQIVLAIMALILSFIMAAVIREADLVFMILLNIPLLGLAVFFSCPPKTGVVLLMISAISGIWILSASKKAAHLPVVGLGIAITVVCFLIPLLFVRNAGYEPIQNVDEIKERFYTFIDEVRYGKDALFEGDFTKELPNESPQITRLQVQTDGHTPIYLCGFVGARYDATGWKELKNKAYTNEYLALFDFLAEKNFDPSYQLEQYLNLNEKYIQSGGSTAQFSVNVENQGGSRKYLYTPESITEESFKAQERMYNKDKGIRSKGLKGKDSYHFKALALTEENWDELSVSAWTLMDFEKGSDFENYLTAENIYRNFVYENYLDVSDETKNSFDATDISGVGGDSLTDITYSIRGYLQERLAYHDTLFALDEDKEFIKVLLEEQKKGNSAAFATAGTLLYRICGIPARYVEGYYLDEDLLKADDNKQIPVTDRQARSWVEIYLDGIGWVPVEVTPGYYETNIVSEITPKESQEEVAEGTPEYSQETGKDPGAAVKAKENQGVAVLLLILAAIAAAVLCLAVRRYILKKRREKQFFSEQILTASAALCRYLEQVLEFEGIEHDFTKAVICTNAVGMVYGQELEAAYAAFLTDNERIRFGNKSISSEEKQQMVNFVNTLAQMSYVKCSVCKKLALKFIYCLR